jgi:hypothetical protein
MALYKLPNGKWVSDTVVPNGDSAPRALPVDTTPSAPAPSPPPDLPAPQARSASVVLPSDIPTATPAPTPQGPTLADRFDSHFKGSALDGTGQDFVNAGYKYGIDPTLLASISSVETDKGTSHAVNAYNNVGGMMDPKSPNQTGFLKYNSVQEGIDAMASNLKRNYINQGLTTIPQIASLYSPVKPGGGHVINDPNDTNRTWPMSVAQVQKKFGGGLGLMN